MLKELHVDTRRVSSLSLRGESCFKTLLLPRVSLGRLGIVRNKVIVDLTEAHLRRALILTCLHAVTVNDLVFSGGAQYVQLPRLINLMELCAPLAHSENIFELAA